MTYILGLTGGIATGKSTASRYFSSLNIPVVDSDVIAREVVEPGTIGLAKIREHFGESVLKATGELNRQALGSIVFSDSDQRKALDTILFEELNQAISQQIAEWVAKDVPLVVVDVPLLYEAGYETKMTAVMVIYVPEGVQEERLMTRDNLSLAEAQKRIASQMPIAEKQQRGDIVIDNSGPISETERAIQAWLEKTNLYPTTS